MAAYTQEQVTLWLSRLARGMQKHGQTVFLIEQLQPSWLETRQDLLRYVLITRLTGILLVQFVTELLLLSLYTPRQELLAITLMQALMSWMIWGAALALLDLSLLQGEIFQFTNAPLRRIWKLLPRRGRFTFLPVLIIGLAWAVYSGVNEAILQEPPLSTLVLIVFWITRQRFFFREPRTAIDDITTVETLRWSWGGLRNGLAAGSGLGLLLALILVLLDFTLQRASILEKASSTGCFNAIFLPIVGAFGGAVAGMFRPVPSAVKTFANQGILLSRRSAILAAWRTGLVSSLAAMGMVLVVTEASWSSVLAVLCFGLGCGLLAGLWYGGLDVLFHRTLRRLIARNGGLPWDLAAFLDFCTDELHILQRVGGGYIFLHRYLLEYFAETGAEPGGKIEASPALPGAAQLPREGLVS